MTEPKRLHYWHAGGSICTVITDSEGRRAVAFIEDNEIPDLIKWFDANPDHYGVDDFRAALAARNSYRAIIHAD